jgi:putative inorganic carbon (HCO3(-)) transporter
VYARLPRLIDNVPGSIRGGFHPNEVGGALALLLPVSLAALMVVWESNPGVGTGAIPTIHPPASQALQSRWARLLLSRRTLVMVTALCFSLMAAVAVLTQSRSAYLGVALGLIVLGALRIRWVALLLPLLALLGLALLWSLGAESLLDGLLMLDTTGTAAGRFEVWQRALYMLQDFPYTGIGLNTFPYVGDAMYPYFLLGPDAKVPHAHNNLLQVGVDLGIPGAVAYLALLTTFFLCAIQSYRSSASHSARLLSAGLLSGMLAHQVYGLSDAITLGAKPAFILWIMLGLVAALYRLEASQAAQPSAKEA